ncbi:MAG TPA: amino acid ABC transporter substrate-binding protein [Terriglobales bacterium]|nr:amino acid ABC transporter substrate-binding protein [Terriglobales bacterium]
MNERDITVGLSASLSGRFALQGRQALQGCLLWQSYVNREGGIAVERGERRPVRLVWYDDGSQIRNARNNLLRLIREDRVDALLGPYSSVLTIAVAEIAEEHKKVLWNHGGASDEISGRGWKYLVNTPTPASDYLRALPHWLAATDSGINRIAVLYSEPASFARQVARGVVESAAMVGQSVELVPIEPPVSNPASIISAILACDPEAVVLAARLEDELAIMRTRQHWPARVRAVAAVAAGIRAFSTELGPTAEGVLGPSQWEPSVNFPEILGPGSTWFVHSFQKQFGALPDYVAAGSFASGVILAECIHRVRCTDNERLRGAAGDLDCHTLHGRFRIDPGSGKQIGHRVLLIRWRENQKQILSS